jgi:hypothetical protein
VFLVARYIITTVILFLLVVFILRFFNSGWGGSGVEINIKWNKKMGEGALPIKIGHLGKLQLFVHLFLRRPT